jgi:hypothetical protein
MGSIHEKKTRGLKFRASLPLKGVDKELVASYYVSTSSLKKLSYEIEMIINWYG